MPGRGDGVCRDAGGKGDSFSGDPECGQTRERRGEWKTHLGRHDGKRPASPWATSAPSLVPPGAVMPVPFWRPFDI